MVAKAKKKTRINREIKRLSGIYKEMDPNKMEIIKPLIQNAAFMTITLMDLQDDINEDGVVSEYQNGENHWGTKKSPEVEVYNTMVKNFTAAIKILSDLSPAGNEESDQLIAFLTGKRK